MRGIFWFFVLPLAAWAQLDDNTVIVSASRQLPALQPDQATFSVDVTTPLDSSLDDVLAILAGSGITAANLTGVSGNSGNFQSVGLNPFTDWTFTLAVPISKMAATAAALNASSAAAPREVSYSVYSQVSQALQASQQCPYALLVADAQGQAQRLASAAGARVGPIVSLSDGSAIPAAGFLYGDFAVAFLGVVPANQLGSFLVSPQPAPPTCAMTVQFSLLN